MNQAQVRWTTSNLELLPDNGNRYEIVDGELFVTRAPGWKHQRVCNNICTELNLWSQQTGLGEAVTTPGIIFTDADNVIPDVVWISKERLAALLDEAEHLTGAPELVVEVLSPGETNERRDKEAKLKLYAAQGVREYWIADPRLQQIQVYRRENATLVMVATLFASDELTSPLLPGSSCAVARLFG
ncbi:Uma2 family endonuclease [Scytonema millei]|uniref:Uma2 family endonuclease n=1 Tax=Scytonema millei VB511283 TaxID=1245923 RepID=A0A9X5E998_9CYAN|nr:Uma2 family endonuclease [Scytonema millei]NHC37597.1 Uma2 family endonuclease [Scytonema millei VB511283]